MIVAILIIILIVLLINILYFKNSNNYWKGRNVPIPITENSRFGLDSFNLFFGKENILDYSVKRYNSVKNVRYFGDYLTKQPSLTLKDPKLIKQICVKDFDHFLDHRSFIPEGADDFFSRSLFLLKGQNWKKMRSTMSPSFTSSKMKSMFILICQNAELFIQYFLKKDEELIELEFKDAFTRYTSDVITNITFGVKVDSLNDRENEFFLMGKEATDFGNFWARLRLFIYFIFPKIASKFKIEFFTKRFKKFFITQVRETIKFREEHNIKNFDMLGLLMEVRKEKLNELTAGDPSLTEMERDVKTNLTDIDIAAQMVAFFFGGYDSTSLQMCFMAQELAENPDIQERLIEEIDENKPESGPPSYETIFNMTYMDMVVSETLRKWPINPVTDRLVTKPYTIEPELPEEKPIHLKMNESISIPIVAIHYDTKYWENPKKFNPERFSPENKQNIDPYTFLPFGVGPRNCIGSRFVLLEIKAIFFYLLSHFKIVPIEKTEIPIKLSKKKFNIASDNGFHLGLKRRY